MAMMTRIVASSVALLLSGCAQHPAPVLGTLEWDRITLPAPVSERIAQVAVREGQTVTAGETLLVLESVRTRARLDQGKADVLRLQRALDELRNGARREDIDQARARLRGAQAVAINAHQQLERVQALVARQALARAELDKARAAANSADAEASAVQAALASLANGSRPEAVAQAEAAVAAAQSQVEAFAVDLQRTRIVAPRDGRIESIPFKLGDQPAIGAPLAIELIGDAPYARVYVPERRRAQLRIGDSVRVHVDGREQEIKGRVRMIRSEPSFTPYYALNGDDASRLSYLAEIELGKHGQQLPAGLPVRIEFGDGAAQ